MESMTPEELENYKLHRRFDRMGRLIGDEKMNRLMDSHVMVVGLGGVGSWAVEALARSGIGMLTLIDFDEVCITNFNRQVHSVQGTVGTKKCFVLEERVKTINPKIRVKAHAEFMDPENTEKFLADRPHFVIDAIDNITSKCFLLNQLRSKNIPCITSTGSGGRMDPTQVRISDLAHTTVDPLGKELRRILRSRYGFPNPNTDANKSGEVQEFGIPAIFSAEQPTLPLDLHYDGEKGFRCVCPQANNPYFQCESRNIIMGNAGYVTGAFGLAAASAAVKSILK